MGLCGSKDVEELQRPPRQAHEPESRSGDLSLPSSGEKADQSEHKKSLPTVMENKELTDLPKIGPSKVKTGSKHVARQAAKILLLGAGESGKSTILKQIKIIYQSGFSDRERADYTPFIHQNIIAAAQSVVNALETLGRTQDLESVTTDDLMHVKKLGVTMGTDVELIDSDTVAILKKFVAEPAVLNLINGHSPQFYLLDSAAYFFENLNRIFSADYMPDDMDILRTRRQTSGIFDTKFQMEDIDIHLYDVGGQRSERKKWIHCFDNVTAIMFCVALSEYDQPLLESSTSNRLEESLDLFDSVINSMWFRRTSIILCLNKIDVFIEKLPKSPLENFFPDYVGGNDVGKAVKYILWRFKQLNRSNLNMVPYVTQATDTTNIESAFSVVKETIVHNNLVDSGVIAGPSAI